MNPLHEDERERYQWQMWIEGLGEAGQLKLKASTVLISRIGGVGGTVAYYLAAAGIGRLILAHGGSIKKSDLNRQLLMTTGAVGSSRVESAKRRLHELNPHVEVETHDGNLNEQSATELAQRAHLCVGAAPLFQERFALNLAAVRLQKPLVDAAMYSLQAQLMSIQPGRSACLCCLSPEPPQGWVRQFPVIGAVSGTIAALAAMEAIKIICGFGQPLYDRLLLCDLGTMSFQTVQTARRPDCKVCAPSSQPPRLMAR